MKHLSKQNNEPSISIGSLFKSISSNHQLIAHMIKHEVVGRYKGSIMGITWSFLNPLFMLLVYTFVFSVIFKSRWGTSDSKLLFAFILFVGMIVIGFFNEVVSRSPLIILSNVNYVKKVMFPIEILSIIAVGTALIQSVISFIVLLMVCILTNGYIEWTVIFMPLIFLPLVIFTLGISWMLCALGVFFRDTSQTTNILTSLIMFLSPVFYPLSAVPERFRPFIMANPLTFIIEELRGVLIGGHYPNWNLFCVYTFLALVFAWLGYALFQKARKGFADVL